jgi:hypothetical protein
MNSFDKKIKEKLEQLPAAGADEAWTRLLTKLPKPFYLHFFQNYAGWIMATSLAGILIFQQYKINDLAEKIDAKSKIENFQKEPIEILKSKPDTVFKEKIVFKDKLVYVNLSKKEEEIEINKKKNIAKIDNQVSAEIIDSKTSKTSKKPIEKNTFESQEIADRKPSKEESSKVIGIYAEEQKNELKTSKENMAKGSEIITESTVAQVNTQKNIVPGEMKEENQAPLPATNNTPENKELPNPAEKTAVNEVKDLEKTTKKITDIDGPISPQNIDLKTKKANFKNLNARIGVQAAGSFDERTSVGPTFEVFINKNLSISSGVFFTNSNSRKINQPQEFNKRTGKRFEDIYKGNLGEKQKEIKNIEIQTTSIIVPVQTNYYFHLKNNFSIHMAAAALLNFNEKDDVVFEGKAPLEEVFKSRFENKRNSRIFYGLNYGIGLQYNYKRLYFNVLPTLEFPFSKSLFLNERNRFNLNASIKFALKK